MFLFVVVAVVVVVVVMMKKKKKKKEEGTPRTNRVNIFATDAFDEMIEREKY